MGKLKTMVDDGVKYPEADIFQAARENDVAHLSVALEEGQSLKDKRQRDGMTPVHEAASCGSWSFLAEALEIDPSSVWIRDGMNRRPIEHANARNDQQCIDLLANVMYPRGPVNSPI